MSYEVAINVYLADIRATTIELSELEEQAIRLLPSQTEVLQYKLAHYWQHFKVTESAVPLAYFWPVMQ